MEPFLNKEKFELEVQAIEKGSGKRLETCLKVIRFCHQVLERYRATVIKDGFANLTSEINFFKHQKQIPQETLVYYSLLKAYELEVPTEEIQKKEFIISSMQALFKFDSANLEFKQYVELDADYLDEVYYTRKFYDVSWSPVHLYYRDPVFSSSRDLLLSELRANKSFLNFLHEELNTRTSEVKHAGKLKWTSSKVALTELVYALHQSGVLNNGNITLKEIVEEFQAFMGFDLGDYHHTFVRLRERSQPLKFLHLIKERLAERMQELDQ